jgi:hypothetical protein
MTLQPRRAVPSWVLAAGIAAVFFGAVLAARLAGVWSTHIPASVYFDLVPRAQQFIHP